MVSTPFECAHSLCPRVACCWNRSIAGCISWPFTRTHRLLRATFSHRACSMCLAGSAQTAEAEHVASASVRRPVSQLGNLQWLKV